MGRNVDFTDQGVANFFEAIANGSNKIGMRAPATVAADIDIELLAVLPATTEVLTIDATGQIGTTPVGAGNLDNAYDFPTPGAGRTITADSGAVVITVPAASGNAALELTQADNNIAQSINKTGVGAGVALTVTDAGTGGALKVTQNGLQDAVDITQNANAATLMLNKLATGLGGVLQIFNDGTGIGFTITQDGGARAQVILQNANFIALDINKTAVGAGNALDVLNAGTGIGFFLDQDGDAVAVSIDVAAASTQAALNLLNAGTGVGFNLTQNGVATAALLTQNANAIGLSIVKVGVGAGNAFDVNNAGTGVGIAVLQSGEASAFSLNKSAVGASALITLTNAGTGNDITADKWSVDANGNATFGTTADLADHSITILANSGGAPNLSSLNFGAAALAEGGIRYLELATSSMAFFLGGTIEFIMKGGAVSGLFIGNPTGASNGNNILVIENGATAPSSGPTNSVVLYSEDVAASAELKVRDEAGNVTTLSPHSEAQGHKFSEDMAWSFYSERKGKYVWVDMLRVVRLLEKMTGEELVFMGEAA